MATPAEIAAGSSCFRCLPDFEASLLYLLSQIAGVADPATIAANASCFNCIADKQAAILYLLDQIASGGGGGGTTPGAPVNSVQFNDAGAFAGDAGFTFDSATDTLNVTNITAPASANTQVLFNDGGVIAGDAGLTYNKAINYLTLSGVIMGNANIDNIGAGDGLRFTTGFTSRWDIVPTGHLVTVGDNALDIGASGANRPRTGYFGTSVITPLLRLTPALTVATLPAAGVQGRIAYVTDALAPAFLAIAVGGGGIVTTVFDNGTNWVSV